MVVERGEGWRRNWFCWRRKGRVKSGLRVSGKGVEWGFSHSSGRFAKGGKKTTSGHLKLCLIDESYKFCGFQAPYCAGQCISVFFLQISSMTAKVVKYVQKV
jgi:hypothetical protein